MINENEELNKGNDQDEVNNYLKVGKKPIFERVADRLDDLVNYSSQRLENKKIAELLGISESSFYKLLSTNKEFKDAYNKGLESSKYALEKALFKRAEGFTAQEIKIETDAGGNITKTTVTDKNYVPDTTAAIFALKNIYPEKYKDRIESVNTINVNIQQLQNLPDEELLKYINIDVIDNADYSIE